MNPIVSPPIEALTFDCYGTLVDWESGILGTLHQLFAAHDLSVPDGKLLEAYGEAESTVQAEGYSLYRDVLHDVSKRLGARFGFDPSPQEQGSLAAGLPDWPVFSDTVDALRVLGGRYRLAIVSNIDDDLFAGTHRRIGVEFDEVVTAEQVRSYKPDPAHFKEVLSRLDLPLSRVVHVAQSLFHDIAPARALGFRTIWVNRRTGHEGGGATPESSAIPTSTVADLGAAVSLLFEGTSDDA